jgi:hypothetical protein
MALVLGKQFLKSQRSYAGTIRYLTETALASRSIILFLHPHTTEIQGIKLAWVWLPARVCGWNRQTVYWRAAGCVMSYKHPVRSHASITPKPWWGSEWEAKTEKGIEKLNGYYTGETKPATVGGNHVLLLMSTPAWPDPRASAQLGQEVRDTQHRKFALGSTGSGLWTSSFLWTFTLYSKGKNYSYLR